MGRHKTTQMDIARDELMSHIVRCEVLEAHPDHRFEWLEETMDYMAGRYPQLSDLQLTQLETIGRQYLRPAIEHGSGYNAVAGRTDETPFDTTDDAGVPAVDTASEPEEQLASAAA